MRGVEGWEQFITEHSKRAEAAITERYQERVDPVQEQDQENKLQP